MSDSKKFSNQSEMALCKNQEQVLIVACLILTCKSNIQFFINQVVVSSCADVQ